MNLYEKATNEIERLFNWAVAEWPDKNLNKPTVSLNLRGKRAGTATFYFNGHPGEIRLNKKVFAENETSFLEQTIPHEYAHILANELFRNPKPHGREWKTVMRRMGKKPFLYHNYKVEPVKKYTKFHYKCARCGNDFEFTKIIHNKIISGRTSYFCRRCKRMIEKVDRI